MPINWKETRIGEIADFRNGINYTKESFGRGVKVIGVKDFQDYSVPIYDQIEEINPEGVIKANDLLLQGDILFVRSNGNRELIGRTLYIDKISEPISHSAFTIRLRFTSSDVDPKYYAYLFRSRLIRDVLSAYGGGTNISNLNQQILSGLVVPLPPISIQHKIADVLSAYDDLIENNKRRISILEQLAQSLYQEWFGRVGAQSIPEGWKIQTIGELCEFISRGVTPRYLDGSGRFIINQKSNRGSFIDVAELKELSPDLSVPDGKFARVEDLLINSLGEGTLGRVHYFLGPDKEWAVDQHMTICRSSIHGITAFLYSYLSSTEGQSRIERLKTGATNMTMLNISSVRQFELITPPFDLLEQFYGLVKPFFQLKKTLEDKNANLRQTRDLLLPRLVSGDVDISG